MSDPRPPLSRPLPQPHFDAYPTLDAQSRSSPPSLLEVSIAARLPVDTFSPMCPSARTSYTRVDFSGTGAETPRRLDLDDDTSPHVHVEGDDEPEDAVEQPIPQTPLIALTFLLISGRRRTMSFEPETTVGRVKELVWNAWPNEWQDERPPAPSYLRILHLGKILQDDEILDKLSFPTYLPSSAPTPTIVHLSVRSYAPPTEDTPKKKRRRTGSQNVSSGGELGQEENVPCCSCVIC
ncbi:Ubiquitin-like protein 3 [Grifola frondosa]|uniref:Ubiquitin-like protein 3 n=1 Tax=Grifola frondosa TaxID=5627 RepID=A0A1C7MLQ0_GRIFR|nr:Ubiquitin-like protein 3 [Grifola frondosa]